MYGKILVAVDGSEAAKCALDEAIRMAKLAHASLAALYVIDQSAAFTYAGPLHDAKRIESGAQRRRPGGKRARAVSFREHGFESRLPVVRLEDDIGADGAVILDQTSEEADHDGDMGKVVFAKTDRRHCE